MGTFVTINGDGCWEGAERSPAWPRGETLQSGSERVEGGEGASAGVSPGDSALCPPWESHRSQDPRPHGLGRVTVPGTSQGVRSLVGECEWGRGLMHFKALGESCQCKARCTFPDVGEAVRRFRKRLRGRGVCGQWCGVEGTSAACILLSLKFQYANKTFKK